MADFAAYTKVILLFSSLSISGIVILRRFIENNRPQLIIPAGVIFGIGLFIFLINLLAHIIKGIPGFYISLLIQIAFALWVHFKFPVQKFDYPRGRLLTYWLLSLLLWTILLYQITAHSWIDGADSTIYYSLAARFIRGDYPIHFPSQPDYVAYNHIGGPQLIGAAKSLTNAPYYFLHAFLALITLLSISQILTWLFTKKVNNLISFFLISLPPIAGIITLGSFMLVYPVNLQFPQFQNGFFEWLRNLPTLTSSFETYGAPTSLDGLVLFLHRFLATSLFISILVPLLFPKGKSSAIVLVILCASIGLVDESVFLVTIFPVLILAFFTIFKKSIKLWAIFSLLIFLLVAIQGGIITESLLNRYGESKSILYFPKDGVMATEKYRSYRLFQQETRIFDNKNYLPFKWLHPAIYLQILALLFIALKFSKNSYTEPEKKLLLWILFLSSLVSFIAYHVIVPKGYTHPNGNRFLTLSFYLSGLGIAYFISWFFETKLKNILFSFIIKGLIVWILITSIIPPLSQFFPRKKDNFLKIEVQEPNFIYKWIEENIDKDKRILSLVGTNPVSVSNLELAREAGALTPIWAPNIRVHDSFDTGPTYFDFYYTLNPEMFKILGVNYILTSEQYRISLPRTRQIDLSNPYLFMPIFSTPDNNIIIYEVQTKYSEEGTNFDGTFTQLQEIAPKEGAFYIDYPPNITENIFRALRLLLNDREIYYNPAGAFYNQRIDIDLRDVRSYTKEIINENYLKNKKYDFLLLGANVDPETFCHCQAKLLWKGLGNGVKFWKTR